MHQRSFQMSKMFRILALSIAVLLLMASAGQAQTFQLSWYDSTGTTQINSLTVAPNSSFSARVYMTQTSGPPNYLENTGMFAFSVALDVGNATAPVSITSTSNMIRNPIFDEQPAGGLSLTSTNAQFSASANTNFPVLAPAGTNRILLGTVNFQMGASGSQLITASDGSLFNVDALGNNMFPISGTLLAVVPEPSTILLIGAGCHGLGRLIVRRRKAAVAPVLAA